MRPLDSSPDSFGAHKASIFPHAGPASYTQVTVGSPAGTVVTVGGDIVEAVEAGMKLFDFVVGGLTDDGLYEVKCIPLSVSGDSSNVPAIPKTTYRLMWFVVSTGSEVAGAVDLSASIVRLSALGIK